MRTPTDDVALALGFLFSEGIISDYAAVTAVTKKGDSTVEITLASPHMAPLNNIQRNFYTSSSCGICSKASIDNIATASSYLSWSSKLNVSIAALMQLPDSLIEHASLFKKTGSLHAAALFDQNLNLLDLQEDVGRHNAMDKLIGKSFMNQSLPWFDNIIIVSGRLSFELVQKASMTGCPILCAIGAPSTLAIEEAAANGITLVGFMKDNSCNVYTHYERIIATI
jgi:FdhD protein